MLVLFSGRNETCSRGRQEERFNSSRTFPEEFEIREEREVETWADNSINAETRSWSLHLYTVEKHLRFWERKQNSSELCSRLAYLPIVSRIK